MPIDNDPNIYFEPSKYYPLTDPLDDEAYNGFVNDMLRNNKALFRDCQLILEELNKKK
jgi:hypothetical protein